MTKLNNFLITAAATATVLACTPLSALAQDTIDLKGLGGSSNFNSLTGLKPSALVSTGINLILIVAALISFFFLLMGGVQWILAGGDKEGTEKARKKITAALVGLAIVFSAYAISFIIKSLFGVDIFSFELKQIGTY